MTFVPTTKLSNIQGEENLTDYQFGKKRIHHTFCTTCGIRPFAKGLHDDGSSWAMINVRCLDGVDPHQLTISRQFDGKSL